MLAEELLYLVNLIGSALSLMGSGFVLVLYCFAKPLRMYAFKLVAWVAFYDLIRSVCLLIPARSVSISYFCDVYGVVYYQSILGSVFWSLAMSVSLYQSFILKDFHVERHHKKWLACIFSLTICLSVLPLPFQAYGVTGPICEIKEDLTGMVLRAVVVIVPEFVCFVMIGYFYCKVARNLQIRNDVEDKQDLKRFLIFPLLMLVCFVPALVNSFLMFFQIFSEDFQVVSACFFVIHGFFNSVCYGVSKQVISYLKSLLTNDGCSLNRPMIVL